MSDMKFQLDSLHFSLPPTFFTEDTAPTWLTSENTVKGSTMDTRWFWECHVLKLEVGQSIFTDFNMITRLL